MCRILQFDICSFDEDIFFLTFLYFLLKIPYAENFCQPKLQWLGGISVCTADVGVCRGRRCKHSSFPASLVQTEPWMALLLAATTALLAKKLGRLKKLKSSLWNPSFHLRREIEHAEIISSPRSFPGGTLEHSGDLHFSQCQRSVRAQRPGLALNPILSSEAACFTKSHSRQKRLQQFQQRIFLTFSSLKTFFYIYKQPR